MEYYIYNVPLFVVDAPPPDVDIPAFCQEVEEYLPARLLANIDVVYIGEFKDLQGRNAAFTNGAIYMTSREPSNKDMLENFIHETAHSLESQYGMDLYTPDLRSEFVGKRKRLRYILSAQGYQINPLLYTFTEYNSKFDNFLANEVGYPTLLTLTMGLFASPYGATSLQEYFANGFEKYFLVNPRSVRDISPVLYRKIEEIVNPEA
tara:strand:+ start:168 stop:785 length:618 start_codon:yes stop_codon:yes gene_type:complete